MKVKLVLNEILSKSQPWDLTIEIDGVDRIIRPLEVADLAAIAGLKDKGDAELNAFVDSLSAPKDEHDAGLQAEKMDASRKMGLVNAAFNYYLGLSAKNSQLVGDHVLTTMGIKKS